MIQVIGGANSLCELEGNARELRERYHDPSDQAWLSASELNLSFQHSDTSILFSTQLNVHFNRYFLFFGHVSPSAYALQLSRHISRQPNDTILIYSV